MSAKYEVYVDDNFHFMDETCRYKLGDFETCEEAVAACKKLVDECFSKVQPGASSFKDLWLGYMHFGEDPYISTDDVDCKFSAWDYAKQICAELAKREGSVH